MKECLQTADELSARPDALLECVKHYLLSTSPETGLKIGLDYVKSGLADHTCHNVIGTRIKYEP